MHPSPKSRQHLSRRQFLLAGCGLTASLTAFTNELPAVKREIDCRFTPRLHEGPFYIKQSPIRRDITEGLAGYPMVVRLTLVDNERCEPLPNVPVDIWLASPEGEYSGVNNGLLIRSMPNNEGSTFLRGTQVSDVNGVVIFKSLFPGWYPVTPPHIHFSCRVRPDTGFTSQFFMDDGFSTGIYTEAEGYKHRGEHPVKLGWRANTPLQVLPAIEGKQLLLDKVVGIRMSDLRKTCGYFEAGC